MKLRKIKYYLCGILLIFTMICRGQVNAEQVLNIGRNVLGMEDYMLSIQYFNQAIKAKPYLSEPYFFRALAKLNLDDYAGAEEDCNLAIDRNRFKTEAYKVRGFARQRLGKDSLAIEDYDIGLRYNPIDKYFLFYKSVAQTELSRFEGADSTFKILLRQYPRFDEGYAARARLNVMRGDTVRALEDISTALSLNKTHINPFLMRADIMSRRGDWGKALEDMDEAIRLVPDEADLYINRAYLRYNNNDFFGAMSDYNYTLELSPDNQQALFNRGLLRFEVRDLRNAAADFGEVLKQDPMNFHARYNRALIYLQIDKPSAAQADFRLIAERYPRFYPVYYGLAEARRMQGDLRGAFSYMNKADDLVRRYVDNPERNPLDRPTIAGTANESSRHKDESELTDEEVMDKFNQLITNADVNETRLSYNEKIKGRVQDRNLQVEPEPMYSLSFIPPQVSLRALSNYFRELDQLNQQRYISLPLHLVGGNSTPADETEIKKIFDISDSFSAVISSGQGRPVDYMARGVARTMLKDYDGAEEDFTRAIEGTPGFVVAYMGRGYARYLNSYGKEELVRDNEIRMAMEDYDEALRLNPTLVYAWFNKGNIYYLAGDYTSALQCYSEALKIDPDLGQAYFNRGLSYLQAGNRQQAFSDLGKAGELGVLPSYSLLKRMK